METTQATIEQPLPHEGHGDIVSLVIADMEARAAKGVQTYGTRLQAFNGRDALVDAYQEALDLAIYLRQFLHERELMSK